MKRKRPASLILEELINRVRSLETENKRLEDEVFALLLGENAKTAEALLECKEFMESFRVNWDKFVRASVAIKNAQEQKQGRQNEGT